MTMCFMADASALSPFRVIYGRAGLNGGSSHMPINTVVIFAFRIVRGSHAHVAAVKRRRPAESKGVFATERKEIKRLKIDTSV